jgi:hypothetical protein
MAGTDCGFSARVGHAKFCRGELEALRAGAAIASDLLRGA